MNRTLMSSLYPALEQSRHSIHKWQKIVPDIAVLANYCDNAGKKIQLKELILSRLPAMVHTVGA